MTILQSIILGIIQGITEFLPISSSAHLVLIPYLLNWQIPEAQIFPFDVLVQLGTIISVIIYYRQDLKTIIQAVFKGILARKPFAELEARIGWLTILATIPAGITGLLLKSKIESAFNSPKATALFLFVTAVLLTISELAGKRKREIDDLNWKDALWIGAFQALAVFPGISRSGSTITGGMTRNLQRKTAGQFAFLMMIPIMLAAGLLGVLDLMEVPNLSEFIPVMAIGFIVSAVVGYFAISWLIKYISSHSLLPFAGYCLLLGAGSLALMFYNPQAIPAGSNETLDVKAVEVKDDAYQIGIDPNLEWLLPAMNNCQQNIPEMQVIYQQSANSADAIEIFDAYFAYGAPNADLENIYQVGEDHLEIVVNAGNSMQQINSSLINNIFSGRTTTWQAAYESCNECFSETNAAGGEIEMWALPEDTFLWSQFEQNYLKKPLSSFASIAPNSKALRQMVAADPNAIGVLPANWQDSGIKVLANIDEEDDSHSIPISAATRESPDEALKVWLNCIQTAINK